MLTQSIYRLRIVSSSLMWLQVTHQTRIYVLLSSLYPSRSKIQRWDPFLNNLYLWIIGSMITTIPYWLDGPTSSLYQLIVFKLLSLSMPLLWSSYPCITLSTTISFTHNQLQPPRKMHSKIRNKPQRSFVLAINKVSKTNEGMRPYLIVLPK
jgi:hypothetical protein